MLWFEAIILGAVEGITEFLPISSTAHLMFTATVLGLPQSDFVKSFEIAIQLGAILAVVVLYWKAFLNIELLKKLFVAFLPTAAVGFLLYPFIKGFLLGNNGIAVLALLLGGVALIAFEYFYKQKKIKDRPITYGVALFVGLAQSVAVIPGVSRSAATILGGLAAGVSREKIVEFSFLLAVPTMIAATGYDLTKNSDLLLTSNAPLLLIGFITSFVVALFAIRFLLSFVRRYDFTPFGVYRILLALLLLFIVL